MKLATVCVGGTGAGDDGHRHARCRALVVPGHQKEILDLEVAASLPFILGYSLKDVQLLTNPPSFLRQSTEHSGEGGRERRDWSL